MEYEICVSENGVHLFATHPRSLKDSKSALNLFIRLCERFPNANITLMEYKTTGKVFASNDPSI